MYRYFTIAFLLVLFTLQARGQSAADKETNTPRLAVKSNVLYDITTSMNLGTELKVGRKLTLELPVTYNPWTFNDNKKFKFILVQPELRWWLCEPFSGHFFGVHSHYAYYNVGGVGSDWMKQYRFEGWLAGGGITYGYQLYISPRWSLEASIGIGYAYLKYDRYDCITCGRFIENKSKSYFGPTKAAISFTYLIK